MYIYIHPHGVFEWLTGCGLVVQRWPILNRKAKKSAVLQSPGTNVSDGLECAPQFQRNKF